MTNIAVVPVEDFVRGARRDTNKLEVRIEFANAARRKDLVFQICSISIAEGKFDLLVQRCPSQDPFEVRSQSPDCNGDFRLGVLDDVTLYIKH
jgi:hypothetical protein